MGKRIRSRSANRRPAPLFSILVTLASGLLFGLAPALRLTRKDIADTLRGTGKDSAPAGNRRGLFALHALVVSEIALAFILLAGAGLLMASLRRVLSIDPGFRPESVLTAKISLRARRYRQPERRLELETRVLAAARGLPEVSAAELTTNLPIGGQSWSTYFSIEGCPLLTGEVLPSEQRVVSNGYFEAMRIPIMDGRVFRDDDTADRPPVAVIDDVLAKRYSRVRIPSATG